MSSSNWALAEIRPLPLLVCHTQPQHYKRVHLDMYQLIYCGVFVEAHFPAGKADPCITWKHCRVTYHCLPAVWLTSWLEVCPKTVTVAVAAKTSKRRAWVAITGLYALGRRALNTTAAPDPNSYDSERKVEKGDFFIEVRTTSFWFLRQDRWRLLSAEVAAILRQLPKQSLRGALAPHSLHGSWLSSPSRAGKHLPGKVPLSSLIKGRLASQLYFTSFYNQKPVLAQPVTCMSGARSTHKDTASRLLSRLHAFAILRSPDADCKGLKPRNRS